MSRINIGENMIIEDNIQIHDNCIIVDYVHEIDESLNYLNENKDECLICFNKINKNIVVINNNYCKCFYYLILCERCFIYWIFFNCNCLICRKTFQPRNTDFLDLFYFINRAILLSIRLNSLNMINNKRSNRILNRIHDRFVNQQDEQNTSNSTISTIDTIETPNNNIMDSNELRQIQVVLSNSFTQRTRLRRNRNITHIRSNDMLMTFGYVMIIFSITLLFLTIFYGGSLF